MNNLRRTAGEGQERPGRPSKALVNASNNSNASSLYKPNVGLGDGTKPKAILRAAMEHNRLGGENMKLKQRLKNVREQTFGECARILDAIMAYCDAKAKVKGFRDPIIGEDRKKPADGLSVRGCAQGPCGGYTPSGWNKLRSMGLLDDQKDMLPEDPIPGTSDNKEAASGANVAAAKVGGDAGAEGSKFRPSARLLGEMAFQLERRILDYVFGLEGSKRRRFYGYTVNNICYMMEKESTNPEGGSDVVGRTEMTCRLRKILCALEKYGYDIKIHADFSQEIINKYGLLPSPPDERTVQLLGLNDPCTVSCLAARLVKRQSELHNLNILLNCLHFLSKCDGRPLFVW